MKFVFYSIIIITIAGCTTTYTQSNSHFTNSKELIGIPSTTILSDSGLEQSNEFAFELGIRDELDMMFANIYDYKSTTASNTLESGLFPINFHLTGGIVYAENYKVYFIYGFTNILEDFQGFDGGIFLQANFYSQFYGVGGIDFFSKMGSSHGLSSSPKKNYTFYCLGAGFKFSGHFNIDLIYYIPDEKVFGYDVNPESYSYYNKINNGIIKLGFEYIISF